MKGLREILGIGLLSFMTATTPLHTSHASDNEIISVRRYSSPTPLLMKEEFLNLI